MKLGIITDTHFGAKNDPQTFAEFQASFYQRTFFNICRREGVDALVHLGDVFDRRKYSNFASLALAKQMFFEPAREWPVHMLVGNHDAYYKNNNEVNSPALVLGEYDNITLYENIPETVEIGGAVINGYNRADFFNDSEATEGSGDAFYGNQPAAHVSATLAATNQSSLILATCETP